MSLYEQQHAGPNVMLLQMHLGCACSGLCSSRHLQVCTDVMHNVDAVFRPLVFFMSIKLHAFCILRALLRCLVVMCFVALIKAITTAVSLLSRDGGCTRFSICAWMM